MLKNKVIRSIVFTALVTVAVFPIYTIVIDYPLFTRLLLDNAVDEAQRIASHLATSAVDPNEDLTQAAIREEFLADLKDIKEDFGLVKLKIFSPTGLVLFSTDPRDIGIVNREAYFQERVARGENYAEVIRKDSRTLEGQLVKRDVVETYIPLMSGARFRGAFEIYLDITDAYQRLHVLLDRSYFIISLISLFLLVTVIISSVRASRSIRERARAEEELRRANADLSILFEISSAASKILDLDDLLAKVLSTMTRQDFLRFAPKGGIMVVDEDALRLKSHLGHSEEFLARHRELKTGECLCGRAAQTGEVIVSFDSGNDPFHAVHADGLPPSHGIVVVPLRGTAAVVGVLYLYIPPGTVIDENRTRLLKVIGEEIGRAIENARLFARTLDLSLHDSLTGLANRRLLDIMLDNSIGIAKRYGSPLSVLIADIDFFKRYNDTNGHAAGDRLLEELAGIVRNNMRENDLAVRYGGEEFLILLPETGCDLALDVAERVRKTIESKTGITISFGVTCFRHSGETKDALIARADEALYRSKQEGRNRVTLTL